MDRRDFLKTNAVAAVALLGAGKIPSVQAKENKISTRTLNEKNVSLLGFGCMRLPMKNGEIDTELTADLFDYAIRHGVNYFDTAWPYLGGKSETVVGEILKKYPRDSFYLADKCPTWLIESESDVERIFNEQLKKCQTGYFDYYLIHALDASRWETAKKYNIYETLAKLKEQGKIKNIGFSFHDTPDVLEEIINAHPWDFCQLQINYIDWTLQDAKRQYELAADKNIPVVVMEPLRGGNLATLSPQAVNILKQADKDASPAAWGLRYVASLPNVLTVLSGMNVMAHLKENVAALTDFKPLNDSERAVLDKARGVYMGEGLIPCTECRYCKDCPLGINIAGFFAAFNAHAVAKEKRKAHTFLNQWKFAKSQGETPDKCISCGLCEQHCPQHIEIREKLKEVQALYEKLSKDKTV